MTHEEGDADLRPPILVISPHFDDAVLSCGRFLSVQPGSVVLTVMGGSPASWDLVRPWDHEDCGLPLGTDVVALRKEEDREALSLLGCRVRWGDVLDIQYCDDAELVERSGRVLDTLEDALADCEPATCLLPLGTKHPDHKEVRRLALSAAQRQNGSCRWFVYEELPYRPRHPSDYEDALDEIRSSGWTLTPASPVLDRDSARKNSAVQRYRSQLAALTEEGRDLEADLEQEGYWEIGRTKAG
jgi:LmbE family N-acetylglucosaminyl deacetylase